MEKKKTNRLVQILDLALSDGSSFQPPKSTNVQFISELEDTCYELFTKDFHCQILNNCKGQLCSTYPSRIIIPLSQKAGYTFNDPGGGPASSAEDENVLEISKLNSLIDKSKYARTRCRFPVPSIVIDGKFICRSSTLARSPEIYARMGYSWYSYLMQGDGTVKTPSQEDIMDEDATQNDLSLLHKSTQSLNAENDIVEDNVTLNTRNTVINSTSMTRFNGLDSQDINEACSDGQKGKEWVIDKMRNLDVSLLKLLNVDIICDFMVENKKVKFGLNVTSSEKVDNQQRYTNFQLLSVPYPGCEFFAEYQKCDYNGEGLLFDWKQTFVDAQLNIPLEMNKLLKIHWKEYVNWDLIKLTQNYLVLLLDSLSKPISSGVLLHCISGWDRTPLFVSILRLSLWADGLVHESLSCEEVVFLTVAYDWLLFSHLFSDRIDKGEEIMYFCFDFLSYITSKKFSLIECTYEKVQSTNDSLTESIFILDSFYSAQSNWNGNDTSNGLSLNGHKEGFSGANLSNGHSHQHTHSFTEDEASSKRATNDFDENYNNAELQATEEVDESAAILIVKDAVLDHPEEANGKLEDEAEEVCDADSISCIANPATKQPLSYSNSAPASPKCNIEPAFEKSHPIPIFCSKRLRSGSLDERGSFSDCENNLNEPGSWQMVSFANQLTSSSHESEDAIKLPKDLQSKFQSKSGFQTTTFEDESHTVNKENDPKSKLDELYERRKQRLLDAQKIFLPAYKQTMQEFANRQQQQSGAISSILNHLRFKLGT